MDVQASTIPIKIPDLLREVSRSFYLTLRVLPRAVGRPIGLAYLLARATDTVADTEMVPVAERLRLLAAIRERISGQLNAPLTLEALSTHQGTPGEGKLLLHLPEVLAELDRLPAQDQKHIREVIGTIIGGQELDLQRFGAASAEAVVALANANELNDYTYRVAGCVGEFWTRVCSHHHFAIKPGALPGLLPNSVRFGQGLQLVNILRDLPVDLRAGRCYLPSDELAQAGLEPKDLLSPASETRFRRVYDPWLRTARTHLLAGWDYTNALSWHCWRVRLACAWPILIGLDTLRKLEGANVLDPSRRIKISRPEVRQILIRSFMACPWPWAWKKLVRTAGGPSLNTE